MLLFGAKIINKTCEISTGEEDFYGIVKNVHDEWVEIVENEETKFINSRYIISISVDAEHSDEPKPRKRFFGKNRDEGDI